MEGARGDKQDVIRFHRSVFGRYGGAFDQGQQVALHAFTADIAATRVRAGAHLVDLVQKDDAILLYRLDRGAVDGFVIQQLVGLFADQHLVAFGD